MIRRCKEVKEKMVQVVFKETIGVDVQLPLPKMTYAEAMERYGSDKPDTRFGFELTNISDIVSNCGFGVFANATKPGMSVRGINVKASSEAISKKQLAKIEDHAKTYKAKGLAYIKYGEEITGSIVKLLSEDEINNIKLCNQIAQYLERYSRYICFN